MTEPEETRPTSQFPRGWFVIKFSTELSPGQVEPIRYFGKNLVLFRTESGAPRVLDAHCPHLGAHLGYGGKVKGEEIQCPFHGWQFAGDTGHVTLVPYSPKVPPRAKVGCYSVTEKNGMIYLWHDADGKGPDWEVPDLPGYGDGSYTAWNHAVLEIATHPREVVENLVDTQHFMPVHGTDAKEFRNEFKGHVGIQFNEGIAYPLGGGEDKYKLTATYYGPAYMVTHMQGVLESLMINAHTPVEENKLILRFAVALKQTPGRPMPAKFSEAYVDNLRQGYLQDVAIWEHKVYRDRPMLVDGDGNIGALRRWYRQFYEPRNAPASAAE